MLNQVTKIVRDVWGIADLKKRIFFTFMILVIYRLGFHIYLPYVDVRLLEERIKEAFGGGIIEWIGYASTLTGGNLQNATFFSLGIMPYITASIIFSLLVKVIPRLEALSKEGEHGRRAINRYTRYATVLVSIVQGAFVVAFLRTTFESGKASVAILEDSAWWNTFTAGVQLLSLILGAVFMMWLGEKITDRGIGNGSSVLIMAGIVSRMPDAGWWAYSQIKQATMDERPFKVVQALTVVALFVAIVVGVVFITRGQRRIPIQQARTVKGRRVYGGAKHYMPLRVNSAGVMPIIFAQALVVLPPKLLASVTGLEFLDRYFSPGAFWYYVLYVGLIVFFSYFWTTLMYNPVEIANNIKEHGSFIPGIRPGRRTAEYLERILNRITLAGSVFCAVIALVPELVRGTIPGLDYSVASLLGGTSMLIVVGVALDVVDKVEAQMLVRQYDGFVRGGQ
jgi:preprotein translocase subunit SecY